MSNCILDIVHVHRQNRPAYYRPIYAVASCDCRVGQSSTTHRLEVIFEPSDMPTVDSCKCKAEIAKHERARDRIR